MENTMTERLMTIFLGFLLGVALTRLGWLDFFFREFTR